MSGASAWALTLGSAVVALVATPLAGATAPRAALPDASRQIAAIFAEWDRSDSPGCAVGALRDGAFVYRSAFGMANLDHGVPLTPDSVFRMASVSKQFTAAAVFAAAEQGLLSLEDPIREHFPDLPAWADPVRVRHLVHHTSGIRDYLVVMALRGFGGDARYSDAEVLAALRGLERLNFAPGSEYLYSNSGYWLLGQLIRRVSGKTLREFAGEYLFAPLDMEGTHFHDRWRELVPGRATGYRPRPEAEGGGFERDETALDMVGDGGLYTSVNELGRWERIFLDPGPLGPRLVARLIEPGRFVDGSVQDYAGGLVHGAFRGLATLSHGGGFVGFRTYGLRFSEHDFAVFVLCNAANAEPGALARRVAEVFLADALEASPPPASGSLPPVAPGRFREDASSSIALIEAAADGSPVLVRDGFPVPLDDRRLQLVPEGDGFLLRQPGQRDFRYRRVEPAAPALEELTTLSGIYRCRELDVSWEVRLDARPGLTLAGAGAERSLDPVFRERDGGLVFSWPGGNIRFLPDPGSRRARGFDLATGRARGFRFLRE